MLVRPMRPDDLGAVEAITDEAFHDLSVRTTIADLPSPSRRSPEKSATWRRRAAHLVRHDPGGCWVAEDDTGLLGISLSSRRDGLWALSSYAVTLRAQGKGVGTAVLDAALGHSQGCLRGMIASSPDPRAARRYRLAGFTLHPTMTFTGRVERATLPVVERVRDGSATDFDLCDSVDRQVRGSAHSVDHAMIAAECRLVVTDHTTGRGYCYVQPGGGPYLLAATNRRIAQRLLWESLAAAGEDSIDVDFVTAAQEWAVDVALTARLSVYNLKYLALRNMKPPMPYLPSGFFL